MKVIAPITLSSLTENSNIKSLGTRNALIISIFLLGRFNLRVSFAEAKIDDLFPTII
jgi:hypothetical protein